VTSRIEKEADMSIPVGTTIEQGTVVIENTIAIETSKGTKVGATGGRFPSERSARHSTQKGGTKLGSVVRIYDPELAALLGLEE
jgi:hypothetical protein